MRTIESSVKNQVVYQKDPREVWSFERHSTRALRALVGVVLSLDPEGKEKGSWWHSTSDFVLIARDAVVLLIVALGELLNGCQHPFGSEDDKGLEHTGYQQSGGGFAAFRRQVTSLEPKI